MRQRADVLEFISDSTKTHTNKGVCICTHAVYFQNLLTRDICSRERRLHSSLSFILFFIPKLFQPTPQTLSPSGNVVNFITAGQPLEHTEQNVALTAPFFTDAS